MSDAEQVHRLLEEQFTDRIFHVSDEYVWVSGMNANVGRVAREMADYLAYGHGFSTSYIHEDGAEEFRGMQFRYE